VERHNDFFLHLVFFSLLQMSIIISSRLYELLS